MYYAIENNKFVQVKVIDGDKKNIALLSLEELKRDYEKLGVRQECITWCEDEIKRFSNRFEVYEDFSFSSMEFINLSQSKKNDNRVVFIIKKNIFIAIILEDANRFVESILKEALKIEANNLTLDRYISLVFNRMIDGTEDLIDKYEDKILALEDKVINNSSQKNMNNYIFKIKRILSYYLKYYKSLNRFVDLIKENYEIITDSSECRYMEIFGTRVERFISDIEYLLDALIHIQDLYTTSLDYSLNNIMKVFTVVTTIFLPLTLVTGWYGMNFKNMPELTWKYGYLGVIVFSVIVVLLCIVFFKKKKLL